jgi:hypothetical protein
VNLPDSVEKPGIRVEVARASVVGIAIRAFNLLTFDRCFINRVAVRSGVERLHRPLLNAQSSPSGARQ